MPVLIRLAAVFIFFSISRNILGQTSVEKKQQLVPYRIGNKWGFSDTTGTIIIQPKYDEIEFTNRGFKIRNGKSWGLTDQNGKQIHPSKYSEIREFRGFGRNWMWLTKGKKTALADSSGHILVPAKYDFSHYLKDDLFTVGNYPKGNSGHLRSKLGVYRNGKLVTPLKYETITAHPSGHIVLTTENLYTEILNVNQNSVSLKKYKPIFQYFPLFAPSEGLTPVYDWESKSYTFQNEQGQQAFDGNYKFVLQNDKGQAFSNGLAAVSKDGKSYGFIDKTGKTIIPLEYFSVTPFKNNVSIVRKGEKYGILDSTGREVEPLVFTNLRWSEIPFLLFGTMEDKSMPYGYFSPDGYRTPVKYTIIYLNDDNLIKVKGRNGLWGFINKKGQEVIPLIYEEVNSFSEGLAAVRKDNKWGFIDTTGAVVIPFQYFNGSDNHLYKFNDGIAPVAVNYSTWIYITKQNKAITERLEYENRDPWPFHKGYVWIITNWENREDEQNRKYKVPFYNIIDTKGKRISDDIYTQPYGEFLNNAFFIVEKESGCGLIDTTGKIIIPLQYTFEPKKLSFNRYTFLHNRLLKVVTPNKKSTIGYMSLNGKKYWQD